jgi:hypothetical protein
MKVSITNEFYFHTRLTYTGLSAMTDQEEMDERYCDVTGETMDLGLAGTLILSRYSVKSTGNMLGPSR